MDICCLPVPQQQQQQWLDVMDGRTQDSFIDPATAFTYLLIYLVNGTSS